MNISELQSCECFVLICVALLNHNKIDNLTILDLDDLQNDKHNINYIVKKKISNYYNIYNTDNTDILHDDLTSFVLSVLLFLKNHFSNKSIELNIDIELLKEIEFKISNNLIFINNFKLLLEKLNENMHKLSDEELKIFQTEYNLPLTKDNLLDISNIEPICIANLEDQVYVINQINNTYEEISLKLIEYIVNL